MKKFNSVISLLACLSGLLITINVYAEDGIEVVASEGSVTMSDSLAKTVTPVQSKSQLSTGNIISTGPTARAVVRVGSDGFVVIGKNSQIEINKTRNETGFFRQISGIVYYAINSIKGNQRRMTVKTSTATIGIRGTRFIVTDIPDRNEIGMRKGLVNVASPDGEFEIHKKAEQDEFDAYKQEAAAAIAKEQQEFEAYKVNTQKEFIEYKSEFGLEANRMASFDGKRVHDRPLSGETRNDMESLENFADAWVKEVRD